MKKKVFTIYDEKSEAYLQPFFMDTIGQAKRAVTDCVNDVNHQFCKHPSDYTLFELGSFDDSNGEFTKCRKTHGNLIEYKTQMELSDANLSLPHLEAVGGTD